MAETLKVLGQAAPGATTETALYTVPSSKAAVVSTLVVCNRDASTAATFRVSVAVGGGATGAKDYLFYDLSVAPSDSFTATLGLTLAAGDIVRVYAGAATLSFSAFGSEVTV